MSVTTVELTANFFDQEGQPYENVSLEATLYGVDIESKKYVVRSHDIAYSNAQGEVVMTLFSNMAGTRSSYYRITATSSTGFVISDSNVVLPTYNVNLADVEGNWSGEIFQGGSEAVVTSNLTVHGQTTLNGFTGHMTAGTIQGLDSLVLPSGVTPPSGPGSVYWDESVPVMTIGNGVSSQRVLTEEGLQPVSNKAFPLGSNFVSGTLAEFSAACTDANFAALDSPVFVGTPQAPTPTTAESSQKIATTQYVVSTIAQLGGNPSSADPLMDGVATGGVNTTLSRSDHVHPSDTSRATLVSPAFTGTPTAPTAGSGTNTTQIATTAFVVDAVSISNGLTPSNTNPLMDGAASAGVGATVSRTDHVHPSDTSRAPLASPTFTGVPTAPTATVGTNTTQLATTAFVLANAANVTPSNTNPLMDSTAAPGTSLEYSRRDHVHPSDTTKAPLASPTFTGVPAAPTATQGTNTTQLATTAFVATATAALAVTPSNNTPLMNGTAAAGASALYSRYDHIHASDTSRAPLASPTFTGTPAAPTASTGTNTTQLATTAFVASQIAASSLVKSNNLSDLANVTTAQSNIQLSTKAQFNTACTDEDFAFLGSNNVFTAKQQFNAALIEKYAAIGASDIDCATASVFSRTISGATTLTVSNVASSGNVSSFILELTNGGVATVTWWSGIKWAGGSAPVLTTSGTDILGFYTRDGGTTWRGNMMSKDSK